MAKKLFYDIRNSKPMVVLFTKDTSHDDPNIEVEEYIGIEDPDTGAIDNKFPKGTLSFYKRIRSGVLHEKVGKEKEDAVKEKSRFNRQTIRNWINKDGIPDVSKITNLSSAKTEIDLLIKRQEKIIKAIQFLGVNVGRKEIEN